MSGNDSWPGDSAEAVFFTDCHLHLQCAPDPEEFIRQAAAQGVRRFLAMAAGTDHFKSLFELKRRFACTEIFVGCHPQQAACFDRRAFEDALRSPFVCGIGECGLDKRPALLQQASLKLQLEVLRIQLEAAYLLDLPVSLHCVRAHGELLAELSRFKGRLRICLHGINPSPELLTAYLRHHAFFSVGPLALVPDCALLSRLKNMYPELRHRLLIESDFDGKPLCADYYAKLTKVLCRTFNLTMVELTENTAAALEEYLPHALPFYSTSP